MLLVFERPDMHADLSGTVTPYSSILSGQMYGVYSGPVWKVHGFMASAGSY